MRKRTDELLPGDRVALDGGRIVRTVDHVAETAWLNHASKPIFGVMYREGSTPEWSNGNSGIAETTWEVLDETS